MAKVKSKVKTSSKVKNKVNVKPKKNLVKNGLIATGVIGALTGIGFLGNKFNNQKNNLQKELDKTKENVNGLSLSDKKNIDLLNKCLSDIDKKEKTYNDFIEKLTKKLEKENNELTQTNSNLINENNQLNQKIKTLEETYEQLERNLNNEKTTSFISSLFQY